MHSLFSNLPTDSAQLQLVVDALPVLVSFVTADERYALVNRAYEEWFGIPRDGLIGRTLLEIIGEDAYRKLRPYVHRCLAGERFDVEEYEVPYRLGGTRDIRVSFVPQSDPTGVVAGYVALLTDITAARRHAAERERMYVAEKDARREAERVRGLVEIERDSAKLDAKLEVRSRRVSEDARDRTEFLLTVASALAVSLDAEVMMQRLVDAIVPARANVATVWMPGHDGTLRLRVHAPLVEKDAASSASGSSVAAERVMASGRTLYIANFEAWTNAGCSTEGLKRASESGARSMLVVPIYHGKNVVAVLAVTRDDEPFTASDDALFESAAHLATLAFENARLYAETERLRRAAEDATAEKDRFLARVSHDLRNPLSAILGWSSLLARTTDPTQIARGMDVIARNAKSQVQLVEDLLDVSRIATGKLSLELAVEDVLVAIDTALDPARLAAQAKGVSLVVNLGGDLGCVTIDPNRFRQIVWNLVANAVKFTPAGGSVTVDVERRSSGLRVVVTDTGRGIEASKLPRIFDSFEQAEPDAHRTGGLGLGLTIVRHLVELHGGKIVAESEGPGKGARFVVELPIRAAHVPSDHALLASARLLAGVRALVVDDQEDARDVVTAILEREGASVTAASSADEAQAAFLREHPEVIVSDIGMPLKDGRALLQEIRKLPVESGGTTPALALTALGSPRDRAVALAAGFDEHLTKPVTPSRLVATIVDLLHRRAPRGR